jgi:hypothetical protein
MKRREFIAGLGSAAAWPIAAHAQQGERTRRIGVLMGTPNDDSQGRAEVAALRQGLAEHGWVEGRTIDIAVRWPGGNIELIESLTKELVELGPDVLLSRSTPTTAALKRESGVIPHCVRRCRRAGRARLSADGLSGSVAAFNKGLGDTGYTDGQNVTIEYHWLENRYERMPALAADLVRRRVAVIFAMGKIRSSSVSSQASPDRTEMRPAPIISPGRPSANGSDFCISWCRKQFVSRCLSYKSGPSFGYRGNAAGGAPGGLRCWPSASGRQRDHNR